MVVDIRTWVKNVANQPPSVTPNDIITPVAAPAMSAKAVLICRPNSHPFQERTLTLDQPVKVGRSVARARGTYTNAIFDCKVLSRNHALLWYENGKFYLQDTKSSNGTFVNNNRLSANGVESVPHEVCSGDIVQFGVDVVENNRKVTHGCIVATLKLYLHDGKEAKASQSLSVGSSVGSVPLDELYKLNQYLQDALQREQLLDSKLAILQEVVEQTREATNLSWQAFIGEDRLLSRVEILESQLTSYSKNYSEDKMREELLRLQEDKNSYQNSAKESLGKLHQERLDAIAKLTTLEHNLKTTEEELNICKLHYQMCQEDLQELAQKYSEAQKSETSLNAQLSEAEAKKLEQDQKILELQDQIETQEEFNKHLKELQHEKSILSTLISDDKMKSENGGELKAFAVELRSRVENIINKGLLTDTNNTHFDKPDLDEETDEFVDNHKENNVPFTNQTDNVKKENRDSMNYKEMEDLLIKLQEDLKQLQESTDEENDNKTADLDNLREQITHWTERLAEESNLQKESQAIKVEETLDNSEFMKRDVMDLSELKQKLCAAQNDIIAKESTINKLSKELEHLLETSALVNAKINLLENDLLEEKQNHQKYKKETDKLKQELSFSQQLANTTSNEELMMKAKVENLSTELSKRPTVETYEILKLKCANLEKILKRNHANAGLGDVEEEIKMDELDKLRFTELEEELVIMKEKYAECNIEMVKLNKDLEALQKEYNSLLNRSHNVMFLYIAPLILLVAYLLLSSLFS